MENNSLDSQKQSTLESIQDMEHKPILLAIGLVLLAIGFFWGLCITSSFFTIMPRLLQTSSPTPSNTLTATATKLENTPDKSATAPSPTAIIITGTPTYTPTLIPSATFDSRPVSQDPWCVPWNSDSQNVTVSRVIDGDTIEVIADGEPVTVGYIGIDAPELYQYSAPFGIEAAEKNKEFVEGKTVLIVKDTFDYDEQGRVMRYVISGGIFVNLEMLEHGLALFTPQPPNVSCETIFLESESLAKSNRRGIWSAPQLPTPFITTPTITSPTITTPTSTTDSTGGVEIIDLFYIGDASKNEADEYVEISNNGTQLVQLNGWTLSNNSRTYVYNFPNYSLNPGQVCRVYTNEFHSESCGFSFATLGKPVWDNSSDCALLLNAQGIIVDKYCYYP